ncbi:phage Gp37/Gp68 family protein [Oceaniradius stylonematis]|uniref:phage Gp37/Gp68 family protein n=1 Tax=Oceaniradius stylonematis TaxID=2184161 RepID=UPI00273D8296|nr:phage Gp37/Gp68 family protein [Oceaniradius stylonematis]
MADTHGTKIEWTHAPGFKGETWNVINGCELKSEGCRYCYAADLATTRLKNHPSRAGLARRNADGVAKFNGKVRLVEHLVTAPLRWKKPRMVFVCAHGDLFYERVPDEWIDRLFAVMALCPQHVFIVLTKRPERMRAYLSMARAHPVGIEALELTFVELQRNPKSKVGDGCVLQGDIVHLKNWPLPNVWLGVSVENQATADARIPVLLDTPAAIRWVSAEPLLGEIDLTMIPIDGQAHLKHNPKVYVGAMTPEQIVEQSRDDYVGLANLICFNALGGKAEREVLSIPALDWVITGGESGKNARPTHPQAFRDLRDQCRAADVRYLHKQNGEWVSVSEVEGPGRHHQFLDGATVRRIGKKRAGRTIDGRTHDAWPEVAR